eukprot:contig_25257_g6226
MRGEIIFALLYLAWLVIHGRPEAVMTDRGSEAENDVVVNALNSMGIHWRVAPTEAPWSIGCQERHHGPIRDAYLRIMSETPALATDLALAMAYKARNDAPRAHGIAPTTASATAGYAVSSTPITLTFPKMNRDSLRVAVYADYSGSTVSAFAIHQVGYIIVLTDSTHRFAPLHWASHRPSRVRRGTTAGELLALADAVAAALDIRQLLEELMDQQNPPRAYTDSATLYNIVTSFLDPADMSGKNDLLILRRSLLTGVIAELNHIPGEHNPADPLSKPTFSLPAPNNALSVALATGLLHPSVTSTTT